MAAWPMEPAVWKEAERIAVMGSRRLGSMWKGLGRKLVVCKGLVSARTRLTRSVTHGDSCSDFMIDACINIAAAFFDSLIFVRCFL